MNKEKLARLKENEVMLLRASLIQQLLETIPGVDTNAPGLVETPWRVAKVWDDITVGYQQDGVAILKDAMFDDIPSDDIVVVGPIDFHSTCAHHLLPFFGKMHIAYIPKDNRVVGLSKIARVAEVHARRLQSQEAIGAGIAKDIIEALDPLGVAVVIKGTHTCMTARGVKALGSFTTTSHMEGLFKYDGKARAEVLSLMDI